MTVNINLHVINNISKYTLCYSSYQEDRQIHKTLLMKRVDINANKPPLPSWKMVHRPKLKRDLGVINLRIQNKALLMKHLYNKDQASNVSLIREKYYCNGSLPSHLFG